MAIIADDWLVPLVPVALLDAAKDELFADWVRVLPIDPADRKQIIIWWCDLVNVPLTRELVLLSGAE